MFTHPPAPPPPLDKRMMRDAAKINEVCEAIENLCIAVTAGMIARGEAVRGNKAAPRMVTEYVQNSRQWLREAMHKFLVPSLNLVHGGARQLVPPEEGASIVCAKCKRRMICSDFMCPDWHDALRAHINAQELDEPEDNGPRAA